jgi:TetR/AcrR family mexXY operon transcriptional repressor
LQHRYAWEKKRITQINALLKQAITVGELKPDADFELMSLYCQSIIEGVFSIVHFGNLPETQRWHKAEQLCEYGLQRLST